MTIKQQTQELPPIYHIECLIARMWGYRENLIVPGIKDGLGIHECDVLILHQNSYATEVEIKISRTDLKKDKTKSHGHNSDLIQNLYFCIPEFLERCIDELVPERAGVLLLKRHEPNNVFSFVRWSLSVHRKPTKNPNAKKFTPEQRLRMARLGAIRIWDLKSSMYGHHNDRKYLQDQIKKLQQERNGLERKLAELGKIKT